MFVEWKDRTLSLDVNIQFLQTDSHTFPLILVCIAILTAHDFCVISVCKLARARTQRKKFHAKPDSAINEVFF